MQRASKNAIPFTVPMECLPVLRIPEGDAWVYELKLDGYRAQAIRDHTGVRLLSRNGKDLTKKYPLVTRDLLEVIEVETALDGELVAFDDEGKLSFNALQKCSHWNKRDFLRFRHSCEPR
jgi:bifunctional non-homologous end joining protein LigD